MRLASVLVRVKWLRVSALKVWYQVLQKAKKLILIFVCLCLSLFLFHPASAEKEVVDLEERINPHWNAGACNECHTRTPLAGKKLYLKNDDSNLLCRECHGKSEMNHESHPVDIEPSSKIKRKITASFEETLDEFGNKTGCLTCHDPLFQCDRLREEPVAWERSFLRGGPYTYMRRADFCYQCHDRRAYKKLIPHEQINENGRIRKDRCLICHTDMPIQHGSSRVREIELHLNVGWTDLCKNCHWVPNHPANIKHERVPSEKVRSFIKRQTQDKGIHFPLEPKTGEIFCATCHNPHDRGVIERPAAAVGAGEEYKLRAGYVCGYCHNI